MTFYEPSLEQLYYYGVNSVGREPVRKYIDRCGLIDELCQWGGECLEKWNDYDKHFVIYEIGDTNFNRWEVQGSQLHYQTNWVAERLKEQLPLDCIKVLYEMLTSETHKPIKYFLSGYQIINWMEENWGTHLQEIEDVDHWYLISQVACRACNQLYQTQRFSLSSEDIEELCDRLPELGDINSGSAALVQAIAANLS